MSFILDALKKSENERQRQSGPGIFEVKVAPPKPRWPAWAFALAALLVINIGVVIWLTLRHPSGGEAVVAARPHTPLSVVPAPAVPAIQAPPVSTAPAPAMDAAVEQPSYAPSGSEDAGASASEEANSDDYAPAVEPPPSSADTHVTRGTVDGLPNYEEIAGKRGTALPELRLDLHVYAVKPQDRFIFLNMHRLREGDSLPEGVRVERITPEGAILSFHGSKFVLERD